MQFNKLTVLLIEHDNNNALLENGLNSLGIKSRKADASEALLESVKDTKPDVVIVNYASLSDKLLAELNKLNQLLPLPVIVFTTDNRIDMINQLIKADVAELITVEINIQELASIIHIALARFKQQQVLKAALEEARVQLEDRKQIDRAKAILIKTRNFTEDEAYHTLRKLAMDRNITLGEMARNVIAMAELLK